MLKIIGYIGIILWIISIIYSFLYFFSNTNPLYAVAAFIPAVIVTIIFYLLSFFHNRSIRKRELR